MTTHLIPLSVTQRARLAELREDVARPTAILTEAYNILALSVVGPMDAPRAHAEETPEGLLVTVADA